MVVHHGRPGALPRLKRWRVQVAVNLNFVRWLRLCGRPDYHLHICPDLSELFWLTVFWRIPTSLFCSFSNIFISEASMVVRCSNWQGRYLTYSLFQTYDESYFQISIQLLWFKLKISSLTSKIFDQESTCKPQISYTSPVSSCLLRSSDEFLPSLSQTKTNDVLCFCDIISDNLPLLRRPPRGEVQVARQCLFLPFTDWSSLITFIYRVHWTWANTMFLLLSTF